LKNAIDHFTFYLMKFQGLINKSIYQKSILFLLAILFFNTFIANAQDLLTEDPKSFRELFAESAYHMEYQSFNLALPILLKLEKLEPDNANIQYRIGYSYLKFADDKTAAIPHLEKAVKQTTKNYDDISYTERKAPERAFFDLARTYHLTEQLDTAIGTYTRYSKMLSKKHYLQKDISRQVDACKFAKERMENPMDIVITNLGPIINSEYDDYTPVVSADESMLVFTSRRAGSTGGAKNLEYDNRFYEDIYVSYNDTGTWGAPKKISSSINTDGNDAIISVSVDGQRLFIYKPEGSGDVFQSFLMGNIWSVPEKMDETINTPGRETHVSITPDGKTIYFTSERKVKKAVQYGGLDIYRSFKMPSGIWSKAENLGNMINSPYDENSPFIHPNGKRLYFSSEGHENMGGYDIFFSDLNEDGTWSKPTNIGYPINTTGDDIYYVETANGKKAYYSTINVEKGYGSNDIYKADLKFREEIPLTIFTGTLEFMDKEGVNMDASIIVKDLSSDEEMSYIPNSSTGKFLSVLLPNMKYEISYLAGDSTIAIEILNPAENSYQELNRQVKLNGQITGTDILKSPEPIIEDSIAEKSKGTDTIVENPLIEEAKVIDTIVEKPLIEEVKVLDTIVEEVIINEPIEKDSIIEKDVVEDSIKEPLIKATKIPVLSYTKHFDNNARRINDDDPEYNKLIEALVINAQNGYKQVLNIEASASQVPTTKYKSNTILANERGKKTKRVILRSLEKKKLKPEMFVFNINAIVQGPEYKSDLKENSSIYKAYQYVKISAQ